MSSPPFAYVDLDRQIVHVDGEGATRSLTAAPGVVWGPWGHRPPDVHAWPTWSPDGSRIAAFRISREGASARVVVIDVDGLAETEGEPIHKRVPIYLQWSPEGRSSELAVLSQAQDELVLERMDLARPERSGPLLKGSPLFFSWLDGGRLAAFVGEGNRTSMLVLSAQGDRTVLPGTPGNFCSPVPLGDELAWVAHHRGRITILVGRPDGSPARELEIVDGLVALMATPSGGLLRAVAPNGDGAAYRDLRQIDVNTGRSRSVTDGECTAFFPTAEHWIVARRHAKRGTIAWLRVDRDGEGEQLLAELHTTRDLRFWVRFFEQYGPSHPIVDASGKTLLLCGGIVGRPDPEGSPRVWAVPVDGGQAEEVGPGMFATFRPTPPLPGA